MGTVCTRTEIYTSALQRYVQKYYLDGECLEEADPRTMNDGEYASVTGVLDYS